MLRTIIEKEFLEKILTLRFLVALLLSLGLTTISTSVLSNRYAQKLADYHIRVRLHDETSTRSWKAVDRKPPVLSALFSGIENHSAESVQLMSLKHPETIEGTDENPFAVLFPPADWRFIIGVVMSLLAILFAYNAVCGERETSTLALIASNPINKPLLILGKWLGGYLSLIIPCFIGLLIGTLIISTHSTIQLCPDDWGALGCILLGAGLYLGCFFALGVVVSTLTARSSTAILALLFLWGVSIFAIPNLSPDIAKIIYPVPPLTAHTRQMLLVENELNDEGQKAHEARALEIIEKRLTDGHFWPVQRKLNESKREIQKKMTLDYRRKVRRQEQITEGIASLSPYACFTFFATRLAGTNGESEARFIAAVERFSYDEWELKRNQENPNFSYTEPRVSDRLKSALAPLSLLLLFTAVFLVGGYAAFLRYDVR